MTVQLVDPFLKIPEIDVLLVEVGLPSGVKLLVCLKVLGRAVSPPLKGSGGCSGERERETKR